MDAGALKEISGSGLVNSIEFDNYGQFLLSGSGKGVKVHALVSKQWEEAYANEELHEGVVNVARFAPNGRVIVTGSDDRFMKVLTL